MTRANKAPALSVEDLLPSFLLSCRARNLSPKTIRGYEDGISQFIAFQAATDRPLAAPEVGRADVEAFVADQLSRWKPKTAQLRYGALRQFFRWAADDGEVAVSPMAGMRPPTVPEVPVEPVSQDQLKALLAACLGTTFDDRRDTAIIRLLFDSGLRRAELVGLTLGDLDMDNQEVRVIGKGRRERLCPFGVKTLKALDSYLRLRRSHPHASSPALWLGSKGDLRDSGVTQLLRRRCGQAGIDPINPHRLRNTFATMALDNGAQESELMRLAGWRSPQMLRRYTAATAEKRARNAYRRFSPGDRL